MVTCLWLVKLVVMMEYGLILESWGWQARKHGSQLERSSVKRRGDSLLILQLNIELSNSCAQFICAHILTVYFSDSWQSVVTVSQSPRLKHRMRFLVRRFPIPWTKLSLIYFFNVYRYCESRRRHLYSLCTQSASCRRNRVAYREKIQNDKQRKSRLPGNLT